MPPPARTPDALLALIVTVGLWLGGALLLLAAGGVGWLVWRWVG